MSSRLLGQRAGMGFFDPWGDSPIDDPIYGQPGISSPPIMQSPSQPGVIRSQIPSLIAGSLRVIDDIFAPPATRIAQAGASRPIYQAPYGDGYGNTLPVTRQPSIGFGVDSQGVRLSDGSHIGWFPIVGVIGVFFLLQQPGFTRRGR
jgi:hypothetical protein